MNDVFNETVLKFNLMYYAVTLGVGLVLLVIMLLKTNIKSKDALLGICIALGNAWGLFLLVVFMGYGLVEIPRSFWWRANRDIVLNYYRYATLVCDWSLAVSGFGWWQCTRNKRRRASTWHACSRRSRGRTSTLVQTV